MRSSDLLRESLLNLRRRPLRSFFAAGGVAVGALAVALLLSLGAGLQRFIEAQAMAFSDPVELEVTPEQQVSAGDILSMALGRVGTAARPIEEEQREQQRLFRSFGRDRPRFKDEQIKAIRATEHVTEVETRARERVHSIALEGSTVRFRGDLRPTFRGPQIPLVAGRAINPSAATPEAIVAWQWVESFGLGSAKDLVGKRILLTVSKTRDRRREAMMPWRDDPENFADLPVVVAGVTVETIAARSIFVSRDVMRDLSKLRAGLRRPKPKPGKTPKDKTPDLKPGSEPKDKPKSAKPRPGPRTLIVRVDDERNVSSTKAALVAKGFGVIALEDRLGIIGRIFLVIDAVLASVGAVAFLVASLGIANTLIMAIHERTGEIGLWKAMGARDRDVGLLFATEAATMGALGGILGILGAMAIGALGNAIAARLWLENIVGYKVFVFPGFLIFATIGLSTAVSLIAGIFPARRAARLAPVTALRGSE